MLAYMKEVIDQEDVYFYEAWKQVENFVLDALSEESNGEDAKRYQWIKSQSELSSYEDSYALPIVHAWDYKPGPELNEQFESLDAAIDKAMELENEKEI